MSTNIMMNSSNVRSAIRSIARNGKALDKAIHAAAVSCIWHAREHGDVTLMENLLDAMPKGSRRQDMMTWVGAHVPCTIDRKVGKVKLKKGRDASQFLLAEADETPFWEFTKDRPSTPITVAKVRAYLERIANGGSEKAPADEAAQTAAREALAVLPA